MKLTIEGTPAELAPISASIAEVLSTLEPTSKPEEEESALPRSR